MACITEIKFTERILLHVWYLQKMLEIVKLNFIFENQFCNILIRMTYYVLNMSRDWSTQQKSGG